MRVIARFILFLMLTFLMGAVGVLVPAADAQTIHYLQIIDNGNAQIATRSMIDMIRMEYFIENDVQTMINEEMPSAKIEMSELLTNDGQATGDNILNWIENLQPGSDDVVFVYFSGHGGTDTEAKDMYLTLQAKQRLYRKEIVEGLEGLDCRLKIFITETIAAFPMVPRRMTIGPHYFRSVAPVLYNLFFEHEGFLNISSASEGEFAAGDSINGSYFKKSLFDAIYGGVEFEYIDFKPEDGFVSWSEVFELTKEATMEMFERNKENFPDTIKTRMKNSGQTTQTPKYFGELPKRFER